MNQGLVYILVAILLIFVFYGSMTNFFGVALPSIITLLIPIFIIVLILKGLNYL